MKLACLLFGCKWNTGMRFLNNNERLVLMTCDRCKSTRTLTE